MIDAANGYPMAGGYMQPQQQAAYGYGPPPPTQHPGLVGQAGVGLPGQQSQGYGAPPAGAPVNKHLAAAYQQQQQSLLRSNSAM